MIDGIEDIVVGDTMAEVRVDAFVVAAKEVSGVIRRESGAFSPDLGPIVCGDTRAVRICSGLIVCERSPDRADMLSDSGGFAGERFDGVGRRRRRGKAFHHDVA